MSVALHEKGFVFVKQGRPFVCLQQNPIVFAWLILAKYKSLNLFALGVKGVTALKGLKAILRYRFWKKLQGREVWLPVFGHLAIKVHRGYKVFDFDRVVVARVIDQDVASALVKEEIRSVVSAAELEFAPTIYQWAETQRWYEEEYIVGKQRVSTEQCGSDNLLKLFRKEVHSCLEDMIRFKSIKRVETREYLSQIERIQGDSRLLDTRLNISKIEEIKRFLSTNVEQITDRAGAVIYIAFSHGDFSLVNILATDRGIKVIDWEGAKHRGLLNDFFNFFLTEIYYGRAAVDIAADVNKLGTAMLRSLNVDSIALQEQHDNSLQFYRRLYYIERIVMLLERDITDKSLSVILKSIDVFNRFERECHRLIKVHSSSNENAV